LALLRDYEGIGIAIFDISNREKERPSSAVDVKRGRGRGKI
jgi:hypothetical protein